MKKKIFIPIVILSLVVIILVFHFTRNENKNIYGSGIIEVQEVQVGSRIAGQIKEMKIDEGASVNSGDTLAVIDYRELFAQKKAALAASAVAEQTVKETELKENNLMKNVERMRRLFATGDVPEQEIENIETQLKILKVEKEKALAGLKSTRAQVELIQTQIENAFILSPLSGVVLAKNFEIGEIVLPGARLFDIGYLDTVWLKIYVAEREMGRISIGTKALVYADAYPKEIFEGKITWISNEAEFTPKNIQTKEERAQFVFAVKITIANSAHKLFPGMPADTKIIENGNN